MSEMPVSMQRFYSFRRIIIPGLLISAAVVIGILGYSLIEKMSLLDAVYMTVITIATVGYREVHPLSDAGKIFTIFFIIFGVATVVYTAGSIFEFIIEGNIFGIRRRNRMNRILDEIKDHYIISGYGRVGHQVAAQFDAEKIPYVVVDMKPETATELDQKNIPYIIGEVSSDEVLVRAGIKRAKGIVASADSDKENVYVTLAARVLNPSLFVVARASQKNTENKLKKAGADRVISPYFIAGSRMASMVLRPVSVEFLDIVTGSDNIELWIKEVAITERSHLANRSLGEANVRRNSGAMVVSIKKSAGGFDLNPKAESKMEPGDTIVALGTTDQLTALEKMA